jgi:endonuclease YncB( thermonuclease family)
MPLPALLICLIVGVTDGDTLTARCDQVTVKIRLAEVDAPEKAQPFGARSKEHLK